MKRSRFIQVRVSEEERDRVLTAAMRDRRALSEWCRLTLLDRAAATEPDNSPDTRARGKE